MYYIYKITNLLNSKIYIGYHFSIDIEKDKYMGSGKLIQKAIKKYGKHNFKREILHSVETLVEALEIERNLVNLDFVQNEMTYNCVIGGRVGNRFYYNEGSVHNKGKVSMFNLENGKLVYIAKENVNEYLQNGFDLGTGKKDHCPIFDIGRQTIIYVPKCNIQDFLNTEKFILKNTTSDKLVVHHNESNQLKYINPDELDYHLSNGYNLGNSKSGVNKNRIYVHDVKTFKNKRILENQLDKFLLENPDFIQGRFQRDSKLINVYNPETDIEKHINILEETVEQYLEIGFKLGSRSSFRIKPEKSKPEKTWIYHPETLQLIKIRRIELQKFIDDGWIQGHYKKIIQSQK